MDNFIQISVQMVIDDYLDRSGVRIVTASLPPGILGAYSTSVDQIAMQPVEDYESTQKYVVVLLHELAHSTGHEKRLARAGVGISPESPHYLIEEMVAEYTAGFIEQELGIRGNEMDHSLRLKKTIYALQADTPLVVFAAEQAIEAADLILGREVEIARRLVQPFAA